MASNSKLRGAQDRISGLPDAVLCHILSFLYNTRETVKTSALSHRWKNVWVSVPNIDLNQNEMEVAYRCSKKPCVPKDFTEFVDRVLLFHGATDFHRFSLTATNHGIEDSRIGAWICSAIMHNVVELDLNIVSSHHHEIPRSLFMCNTLVSLKLRLGRNTSANTPSSKFFPCLKRLHVTVGYPSSDSMEKLFSCCPALEDLVIDGSVDDSTSYNLCITALKLKRLKITFKVMKRSTDDFENSICRINADVPSLEELEIYFDFLVSYSLKNAKCLRKAKVNLFDEDEPGDLNRNLGPADRLSQLFAGILSAKYLTVSSLGVALDIGSQLLLPTFNNLKYLEVQVKHCRCLQSLTTCLKLSPNLEHLKISVSGGFRGGFRNVYRYCDDEVVCKWGAPNNVPICLSLHLKTICLWEFKGCSNELAVIKYLVHHGKVLNEVTIHTRFSKTKSKQIRSSMYLWQKCLEFPRASNSCVILIRDH